MFQCSAVPVLDLFQSVCPVSCVLCPRRLSQRRGARVLHTCVTVPSFSCLLSRHHNCVLFLSLILRNCVADTQTPRVSRRDDAARRHRQSGPRIPDFNSFCVDRDSGKVWRRLCESPKFAADRCGCSGAAVTAADARREGTARRWEATIREQQSSQSNCNPSSHFQE